MIIWNAKIIIYNKIKAVLECDRCKAAEIIFVPLKEEFICKWCEATNVIRSEDVSAAKKKDELLNG